MESYMYLYMHDSIYKHCMENACAGAENGRLQKERHQN